MKKTSFLLSGLLAFCTLFFGYSQNNAINSTQNDKIDNKQSMDLSYGVEKNMPTFYLQAKEALTYPMAWGHAPQKKFGKWRKEARTTLFNCMGNLPAPAEDFEFVVVAREKRQGYEAQKIMFNVSSYCRIPAYLLVPEGKGPFPAVVMLHDHGARFSIGKEKMIRPFDVDSSVIKEAIDWTGKCYDNVFVGDYYAQNGYVVLSIDALFWGERGRKEGVSYEGQQALAANMLQMGMNWCGLITFDDIQSVAFLYSLPYVDKDRIGAIGHSMGGHRAWMLAAATDKIKAAVAVCWMNTTEYLMSLNNNQNKGGSAYSMILPEIRRYMDYPHVASIACPKPMYFINGDHDKLFPLQGVKDAYEIMQQVWESQGAGDRFKTEIFDSPHYFNKEMQAKSLAFFNEQLKKN